MIPTNYASGGSQIAIPGALFTSGFVPGNTLGAQYWNWLFYHLTTELNNVLIAAGISQNSVVDTQLRDSINTLAVQYSTFSTSQSPTAASLMGDTFWQVTAAGTTTQDFSLGASRAGVRVTVSNTGAGVCTVKLSATLSLALQQNQRVTIQWNGTLWTCMTGASIYSTTTGLTTWAAFQGDTYLKYNGAGAATFDISAGAGYPGAILIIDNLQTSGSNTVTIQTGTGQTAVLGTGAVRLVWDGTQWTKIGGVVLTQVFTSGTGATWKTPWAGSYKTTVVGGGGAGGGVAAAANESGGGGGAAGAALKTLYEAAGVTFTYTIGPGGTGVTGAAGNAGTSSTLADGSVTLTGTGGLGGSPETLTGISSAGGAGGLATGGDINTRGGPGEDAYAVTGGNNHSGAGGNSIYGGGAVGLVSGTGAVGGSGLLGGGGGGGNTGSGTTGVAGGAGGAGVIVVEF